MISSLRASTQGLLLVDRARQRRGWTKTSTARWWQEAHTSRATLRRFWQRDRIQRDIFIALCEAVGISNWEAIAEVDETPALQAALPPETFNDIDKPDKPDLDWDATPDVDPFYGRQPELQQLEHWLLVDRCKLLLITGLAGVGKTALALALVDRVQAHFTRCIWRSLHPYPTVSHLLDNLLHTLAQAIPQDPQQGINCLIQQLQEHRCLLILDGLDLPVTATPDWDELLQRLSSDRYHSCILITSRERPHIIESNFSQWVRCLPLRGLALHDAVMLLRKKGLTGEMTDLSALAKLYAGHPLALQLVASLIHTLWNGRAKPFLNENLPALSYLQNVLEQQWNRLSDLERDIAYWLAIWQEPISFSRLQTHLLNISNPTEVLSSLLSLERQSFIEKRFSAETPLFTLHPLVMTVVTDHLVSQVVREVMQVMQSSNIRDFKVMRTHALLRPGTDDIKGDRILTRIQEKLWWRQGDDLFASQHQLFQVLENQPPRLVGYSARNLTELWKRLYC
jgi:hypothetical protein